MRWVKRILLILVVAAIAVAIGYAMMPKPIDVETVAVERGDLKLTVDEDGRTRVRGRYVITTPVAGYLARIGFRAGDTVKPETVLARITPTGSPLLDARSRAQTQANLAVAEAAHRQARAEAERARLASDYSDKQLKRLQKLADGNAITRTALEQAEVDARTRAKALESAELGVKVAVSQREMARAALMQADGRSPKSKNGVDVQAPVEASVLRVFQESAGVVAPGTPLLELGDPSDLEIVVDVLTADAVRVRPGAIVVLERWGGDKALEGRVRLVEPSAFTKISALGVEEQRVNVVVDPASESEAWRSLGDGYRMEARIVVDERKGVLKIPASAAFRRGDKWAVFVVDDRHARVREIQTGLRNEQDVEVKSGLEEGTHVILHPGDDIAEDVAVKIARSERE